MKKCTVLSLASAAVMLFASAAFSQGVADGSKNAMHVPGEKLDSGLGDLTVAQRSEGAASKKAPAAPSAVRGEDNPFHVPGEKLDSGLSEITGIAAWLNEAVRLSESH